MEARSANSTAANTATTASPQPLTCFYFTDVYFDRLGNSPTPYLVGSVLNALLSITAFWGNVLILFAIWKTASLHSPSKLLIFNLALTDLAIGLITQPLFAAFLAEKAKGISDESLCLVRLIFHLVSSSLSAVSFFSVAAISLDRYIAFHYRFRYRGIVKIQRVSALVVSFWLVGTFWASTWLLKNEMYYPIAIVTLAICLPLTSLVYTKIYRGLRCQQRKVKKELGITPNQRICVLNMKNYRSSTTGMLYIYCLLLLCYLPYLCTSTVIRITGVSVLKQTVLDFSSSVVFFNSSLNPIMYCWRLRDIRTAVLQTLRVWSSCKKTNRIRQTRNNTSETASPHFGKMKTRESSLKM